MAPGVVAEPAAIHGLAPSEDGGAAPRSMLFRLPRIASRLGLVVSQDGDRPRFDGLAFQAARNLRISAKGGIDMDEGDVSGELKFHLDF